MTSPLAASGRLGQAVESALASTGRGRDLAAELGRDPYIPEFLGMIPLQTPTPTLGRTTTAGEQQHNQNVISGLGLGAVLNAPPPPQPVDPMAGWPILNPTFGQPVDPTPDPADPADPAPTGPAPRGPAGPAQPTPEQSWQAMLEAQRREAERLRQQLESEYRSRKADLRAQFEFAETEQERAQLAFLMNSLDDALTAGEQAISAGYNSARAQVTQLARASQDAAAVEQAAVEGLFTQAAGQLSGRVQDLAQQVGPGAGLMGDALSGAEDFYNLLATDAAREAALGQRLSGIIGRDIAAGQERMTLQEASQQADLARSGMQTRASLTAQQQAAVAQRIAEDRRTFVNALQRLQSDINARGGQIDSSTLGTYDRAAQLAFSEADTARRLAADARQQASAFAFQREMMDRDREERLARGETPEFEREMLDFARNLQVWNSLPDEIKTPDLWSEIFGRDLPS